jgi:hypothetical protein
MIIKWRAVLDSNQRNLGLQSSALGQAPPTALRILGIHTFMDLGENVAYVGPRERTAYALGIVTAEMMN